MTRRSGSIDKVQRSKRRRLHCHSRARTPTRSPSPDPLGPPRHSLASNGVDALQQKEGLSHRPLKIACKTTQVAMPTMVDSFETSDVDSCSLGMISSEPDTPPSDSGATEEWPSAQHCAWLLSSSNSILEGSMFDSILEGSMFEGTCNRTVNSGVSETTLPDPLLDSLFADLGNESAETSLVRRPPSPAKK